jgi:hypothetical protein
MMELNFKNYCLDFWGGIYFQLPDGIITMENPFEKGELKERLEKLTK